MSDDLPLRPVEYQILVGLSADARHGYALLQEIEERGGGAAVPGLATLYRALRRMEGDGWIERRELDDEEVDERRRYYALTPRGRALLDAETRRLSELVRTAEAALAHGSGRGGT